MKRFLFVLVVLLILLSFFFWFFSFQKSQLEPVKVKQEIKSEEITTGMKKLIFHEEKLDFLIERISEPQKLRLFPNFEEKLSSLILFKNNNCRFLISGGFYGEDNQPLAWFFTQEKLFRKKTKNAFLNGFLALDKNGVIFLDDVFPSESVIWGLQTGPFLIFKSQPLVLNLIHDEPDRRLVTALNEKNELFFLMVGRSDSLASGPLLKDLPLIVKQIGLELNEPFKAAVNLDGGTASAFLTSNKSIKEYTWIGSFFCLQADK